ncbi:MAG: histidine triad nucleotide-binding protein [Elusimicrobiota bacterium]
MEGCVFCQIADKKIPAKIVYQDRSVTVFQDLNPQAPTHLLLIPNKHIASVGELSAEDDKLVGEIILVAQKLAKEFRLEKGVRLVINYGPEAGLTVNHLHVHLLGGRKFSWPPG